MHRHKSHPLRRSTSGGNRRVIESPLESTCRSAAVNSSAIGVRTCHIRFSVTRLDPKPRPQTVVQPESQCPEDIRIPYHSSQRSTFRFAEGFGNRSREPYPLPEPHFQNIKVSLPRGQGNDASIGHPIKKSN